MFGSTRAGRRGVALVAATGLLVASLGGGAGIAEPTEALTEIAASGLEGGLDLDDGLSARVAQILPARSPAPLAQVRPTSALPDGTRLGARAPPAPTRFRPPGP